jgi:hypothetical protein
MKRSKVKITNMQADGSFTMQVPTKYLPKEYLRATGALDPQEHKQKIHRELKAIREAVARPATILPEVADFLDKHARKLEEELRVIEKRKV